MGKLFQPTHLVVIFGLVVIGLVPYWKIFRKAGFPGPLALLMAVPPVGTVVLYVVAFSRWKPGSDSV